MKLSQYSFLPGMGILLLMLNFSFSVQAQTSAWLIDSSVRLIDGATAPYNKVQPGDTIYLEAGNRDKLLIRNFNASAGKPIVFINKDGCVYINTASYYGISISNCRYILFSGHGNNDIKYGIQIKKVTAGCGISIGAMSSDVEIEHVSIENCSTEGIIAKTDPDCSVKACRGNFTQFNTIIHDNYISNVGNEGMYIGSSYYSGVKIKCNGKDTVLLP
jgi:hypothetical protein